MSTATLVDHDLAVPLRSLPKWTHHASWAHQLVYEILDGRVERPLFALARTDRDQMIRMRVPADLDLAEAKDLVIGSTPVPSPAPGQEHGFLLTYNPTRHLTAGGHTRPDTEDEQRADFARRASDAGFEPLELRLQELPPIRFRKKPGSPMVTQSQLRAAGRLRVVDAEKFAQTLRAGIGAGKSYGLGLLILL